MAMLMQVQLDWVPYWCNRMMMKAHMLSHMQAVHWVQFNKDTHKQSVKVLQACQHFNIYDEPVEVYTDHQPLLKLYNNTKVKLHVSVRMENWALPLQPYEVTVLYRRGADKLADYLSRHPVVNDAVAKEGEVTEAYVNYIIDTSSPRVKNIEEIREATGKDATMQATIQAIKYGR